MYSFVKDMLKNRNNYTLTPSQYFDKFCQDIGINNGTIIDSAFYKNIDLLKKQKEYGEMNTKERFLNAVEIPNKYLINCKNQLNLYNFFSKLRLHSHENNITSSTYDMYWPDTVFDDDPNYGDELLAKVLEYKNIPKCEVHWKYDKRKNFYKKNKNCEYYTHEEWEKKKKNMPY
jgi:hypothetical protein